MTVTDFIDARADEIAAFASHLIQQPSPNPPGDTRLVAGAVHDLLARHGIEVATISDLDHMPNLVATIGGERPGPHLVLNGHMDVYPDGDATRWTRPARSGEIADGRLHGRGAGDMKSGLTTILYAFLALAERGDLRGRLSLCAVSDEMSFSSHGAPLVLARAPGAGRRRLDRGGADLARLRAVRREGHDLARGAHDRRRRRGGVRARGCATRSTRWATCSATSRRSATGRWRCRPRCTRRSRRAARSGLPAEALTYADDAVLGLCTFSVGRIEGGRKINLVADECRAEVDLRLPPGLELDAVRAFVAEVIARHPGASSDRDPGMEPNWTDPADPLVVAMLDAGEQVLGDAAAAGVRHHRVATRGCGAQRGKPAAMIGARIFGQGLPNESIAGRRPGRLHEGDRARGRALPDALSPIRLAAQIRSRRPARRPACDRAPRASRGSARRAS